MGNSRQSERLPSVLFAVFIAGLLPFVSLISPLQAQGEDTVNASFDPTMPPEFDMAKIAGQGSLFQNCNGGLQSAISQSIDKVGELAKGQSSGGPQLGYGMNAVCSGSDAGPSSESLSCDVVAPGGVLNPGLLKAKEAAVNNALANLACKKGKFDAVKAELSCLTSQADMLAQQLTAMQGAYQSNISRMGQDVGKLDGVIADRVSQNEDVLTKLGGDKGNGSKGLIDIQQSLTEALTGNGQDNIPSQIQTLKNAMKSVELGHQEMKEAIEQRTMGLAGECFNKRPSSAFRCKPDGAKNNPPVSAKDYVLCRFQQDQTLGANGVREESSNQDNKAQNRAEGLAGVLDQILSDVPQKATAGANGQVSEPGPASTLLTVADVENQYGDQLKDALKNDARTYNWIMGQIGTCFQRANRTVTKETKMVGSAIGKQNAAMIKADADLKVSANVMLEKNALIWADAMKGLTGMNMPINLSAVLGADPAKQIAGLEDLQRNMSGLLSGNVKQAGMTMVIKSSDPKATIGFSCQGVNGCIAALQNVDRNLKTEIKRVQTFKKDYVMKAKQSVENFTSQMASMMSAQSAALTGRLKSMNAALATLGVSGGINIKPVKAEAMAIDENTGLPIAPKSALALIGSKMNPAMLDVHGDNFSESMESVSEGMKDLSAKAGPLQESKNRIAMLGIDCVRQAASDRFAKMSQTVDEMANCGNNTDQFCSTAGQSALGKLQKSLNEMNIGPGFSETDKADLDQRLNAGMDTCKAAAGELDKANAVATGADAIEDEARKLANIANEKNDAAQAAVAKAKTKAERAREAADKATEQKAKNVNALIAAANQAEEDANKAIDAAKPFARDAERANRNADGAQRARETKTATRTPRTFPASCISVTTRAERDLRSIGRAIAPLGTEESGAAN